MRWAEASRARRERSRSDGSRGPPAGGSCTRRARPSPVTSMRPGSLSSCGGRRARTVVIPVPPGEVGADAPEAVPVAGCPFHHLQTGDPLPVVAVDRLSHCLTDLLPVARWSTRRLSSRRGLDGRTHVSCGKTLRGSPPLVCPPTSGGRLPRPSRSSERARSQQGALAHASVTMIQGAAGRHRPASHMGMSVRWRSSGVRSIQPGHGR